MEMEAAGVLSGTAACCASRLLPGLCLGSTRVGTTVLAAQRLLQISVSTQDKLSRVHPLHAHRAQVVLPVPGGPSSSSARGRLEAAAAGFFLVALASSS